MPYDESKIPEYKKAWNKIAEEAFDKFVRENMGYLDIGFPTCYQQGDPPDNFSYCWLCPYHHDCIQPE